MRSLLLASVATLALSACAGVPDAPLVRTSPADARPGALYGLYLGAQSALKQGGRLEAAKLYDRAVAAAPEDSAIRQRAFVSALLAGDVERAAALAPTGEGVDQRLGRLVRAVEALADGRGQAAVDELSSDAVGYPHRQAAALLLPFAQAAAGDLASATAPVPASPGRTAPVFAELGRAALLERAKRPDDAEAAFKAVLERAPGNDLFRLAYGGLLERRGRREDAARLYREGLADEPEDAELAAALARATARRASAPPLPTVQQGAGLAMLASAAALATEQHDELALAYLHLSLRLDPKLDEAWLLVGDTLADAKDRAGARAAYAKVRPSADEHPTAQARLAWSWVQDDKPDEALRLIQAAAARAPDNETIQLTHAEILRATDRYAEAAEVVGRAIARRTTPDWRLHYLRGTALERANRWSEAEAELARAMELKPEEPEILNYLGYAWVDRGERLEQAFGMIEKAVALRPQSGAIVDSLGWAHYRLGRYPLAVEHLEKAVELEPADPTINDHLGDAYWRVGRTTEARFQWRRVLTLEPEAKLKGEVEAKLASGLGPAGPIPATTTAAKP